MTTELGGESGGAIPLWRPRLLRGGWGRYRRSTLALLGLGWVIALVAAAVLGPLIVTHAYDAIQPEAALQGPSARHLLGTDVLGRDLFSRIIVAVQPVLLIGLLVQLAGLVIGATLGLVAGARGGLSDWLAGRLLDLSSALPWYLVMLYLATVLSPGLPGLLVALLLVTWVVPCRLARSIAIATRGQEFIVAARALGFSEARVVMCHLLPQALPALLWWTVGGVPRVILIEAGLSFLGLGRRPPEPSWGQMLAESVHSWQYAPHLFVAPALALVLTTLAFQAVADGLRDALDVREGS